MFQLTFWILTIFSIPAMAAEKFKFASEDGKSEERPIRVMEVFVPARFAPSSDITFVVNGVLRNSCYRWSRSEVRFNPDARVYEIRTFAKFRNGMCTSMALVPFTQEIQLGRLEPGEHTLRFMNGSNSYLERTFLIE